MQTIKQTIITIIICMAVVAGVSVVSAWTGPTKAPPDDNTSAPINVSATSQYKTGAFGVGGIFHGYSNAYFDGNVGIGTASPGTYKLNVNGPAYFADDIVGTEGFSVDNDATDVYDDDAVNNSPYSRVSADSLHTNGIGAGQIYIEGSAIDANSTIYLGAGKAGGQPVQNMFFGGQIKITGGSPGANKVLTSDASGLATWQTPTSGIGGSGTANYLSKWTAGTTLGNSTIYDNGTNVGIGTANPQHALEVITDSTGIKIKRDGNAGSTGILIEEGGTGAGFGNIWYDKAGYLTLGADGSPQALVIRGDNGNVGIGTGLGVTIPGTNKLQVNGKIQAVGGDICTDQGGGKCLSAAGGNFGGIYTLGVNGNPNACRFENPITGGCSCPSGYNPYQFWDFIDGGGSFYGGILVTMYQCIK